VVLFSLARESWKVFLSWVVSKDGKERTGVRTNVSHASQAFVAPHVCSDGGDGNGGMPAKVLCDWTVWI